MATSGDGTRAVRHWTTIVSLWAGLILLVVEGILALRFILKLAGAAPNGFTDFIYDLSGPLVQPFQGIFDTRTVGDDGVFEPEIIMAMVVYALAALLLGAVLRTIVASAPRPQADTWGATGRDLYVRLSTLHGTLSAAAAAPRAVGSGAAPMVDQTDVEIEQLSASLHELELDPPNERAALAVREVLVALNGVRGALRADAAPPGAAGGEPAATPAPAPDTRRSLVNRLNELDVALQGFRAVV
jgi:hypothetical protein